jgi:hypothetical protein
MSNSANSQLTLNIVPIQFGVDEVTIGRMPKMGKEEYLQLRESHWKIHSFRYDSSLDETFNVPLGSEPPIGQKESVPISAHLPLVARAVQQSILVWLADELALTVLRGHKRLVFWGQADNSLLLSRALDKVGLQQIPDLEVVLRYDIDCRIFQCTDDQPYLGLVIDLATSNIIGIPVSDLCERGLKIVGRYVCRRQDVEREYLLPKLELLGRVSRVDGSRLLLTDTDGVDEIEADQALLEPRLENLNDVIRLLCGASASRALSSLESFRKPMSTATGKLARIRQTVKGLKRHSITIGNGVTVELGELLTPEDTRFPQQVVTQRPTLLFGPQGRKSGAQPDLCISKYGPYMYMQHERNKPLIAIVCESRYRGRVEQFMNLLRGGFPKDAWQNPSRNNPFPDGLIDKYRLSGMQIEYEECRSPTSKAYSEAVSRLLGRLTSTPDLAVVQIRESFQQLYGDENPYLVSKAAFMMADVPTQAIRIEKIDRITESLAYLINTISLAMYAKLDGIPWVISTVRPTTHELVIGLGSAQTSDRNMRLGAKTRYVGITSVFQGDGRYLVWGSTREVEYEHYTEALLSSLRTTVKRIQQDNAWQTGDRVRLVCHVYKRLRDCEVDAIKRLVCELVDKQFRVEFAFLDISWWHPYHIFDPRQPGKRYWDWEKRGQRVKGKGVPQRGLCLLLDKSRGLIHLTGPNELKTEDQGIPKPLLVVLHPDSDFDDMTYLLRQIYHFTHMSWRSFFPATEPVTITYSRLIARLLGNLGTVSDWNSQVLMGSLRDRRWFL